MPPPPPATPRRPRARRRAPARARRRRRPPAAASLPGGARAAAAAASAAAAGAPSSAGGDAGDGDLAAAGGVDGVRVVLLVGRVAPVALDRRARDGRRVALVRLDVEELRLERLARSSVAGSSWLDCTIESSSKCARLPRAEK